MDLLLDHKDHRADGASLTDTRVGGRQDSKIDLHYFFVCLFGRRRTSRDDSPPKVGFLSGRQEVLFTGWTVPLSLCVGCGSVR